MDKNIINRISRATGHLDSIKRMMERGEDPIQILTQLAAVKSEVNGAGKAVLKEYLDEELDRATKTGDISAMENIRKAIDSFMK